MGTGSLSRG